MQPRDQEDEVKRHAEQREAGDQQAGDGPGAERQLKAARQRTDRGLGRAHIGAHRDIHADKARGAGQNGADGKADRDQPAQEKPEHEEDHDADNGDRGVLPPQIGLRALAHRRRDLLHLGIAGIGPKHRSGGPDGVDNGEHAAQNDQP